MKKLFLVSTFIVCAMIPAMAQMASATIFTENGEKIWVVMNGIKQNVTAQTNVKITGLTEPAYKFKIIFEDETIPAMDESIMTQDVDGKPNDVTYTIKKNGKGKYVMRVTSFQPAKGNTAPAENQVSVPVHSTEQVPSGGSTTTTVTHQTTTTGVGTNPNNGNVSMSMGDGAGGNVNFNMNVSGMDAGATGTSSTTTTTTTTTHSSSSTNSGGYSQPAENNPALASNKCMYPMNSGTFGNAKKQVEGQSFEENKLQVAKQVLKGKCISTAQIKEIIGLFSFEKTKVDYAKFAYDRRTDQRNYFNLNDAFSFS